MKRSIILISFLLAQLFSFAQDEIWMHPNRGQWDEQISYKINIAGGEMYLEKTGFTYFLTNGAEIYDAIHDHDHTHHDQHHEGLKAHVVKTTFVGADQNHQFQEINPAPFYENYFLGNDKEKWVNSVFPCNQVDYLSLYDGIDLSIYQENSTLKYDVLISPGADPSAFKVNYEGQDKLYINSNKELVIETTLGTITEGKPIAYQFVNGQKTKVVCEYVLEGDEMHFGFPDGYDSTLQLVIDPQLAFSTFTGSTADNWGMTACPDHSKNLIAGGIVLSYSGGNYPTTSGAYDNSANGGTCDIGLTKFSDDGSSILFSTYIGGNSSETPISVIVDNNNNIVLMGGTGSTNFPITTGAHQTIHKGGPGVSYYSTGYIDFNSGVDLYILKLNSSGTSILGSTYYGGSSTDGQAYAYNDVIFNYGDGGRGEVMIDDQNNIYIASFTKSSDILINNGPQTSLSGAQDAIVAKFNSNLTSLLWSTYLGGSGYESGTSVQLSSTGDIFVSGGTSSSNFPYTSGQFNATFQGGTTDGYVCKFTAPSYNSPKATFLGTNDYDQAYFVQLDETDNVYVYGQTKGTYPITGSVYNNPNSGQFIHKLSNNLATSIWSTSFGASSGINEISPTAFLVSDCDEIYIAGWGGSVNSGPNASGSSTAGMPVTSGAYLTSTSGDNFYLAQFAPNMASLKYGTFMGSATSADHVDGGTSRFDKDGTIYHAVCAACGAGGSFPTTPGAWSTTNGANNCNLAAFKFELSEIDAILSAASPVVCFPNPVDFVNDSQNGDTYTWFFGDGTSSSDFEPSHSYAQPGIYTVMLVVSDAAGCFTPDTAYIDVSVELPQAIAGSLSDTICPGTSVELFAIGAGTYSWGPADVLNDPASATPIATIWEETTFTVDAFSVCGNSSVTFTVHVYEVNTFINQDTAICVGESAQLMASGASSYSWSPSNSLNNAAIPNPIATPSNTTDYIVTMTTVDGCINKDTCQVWVDLDLPFIVLDDELNLCYGNSHQFNVSGATTYLWSPNYNISNLTVNNPTVNPLVDTMYYLDATNACGTTSDSVKINVIVVQGEICPDTTICPGESTPLWATGGVAYHWSPSQNLSGSLSATTVATPPFNTTYKVVITDQYGCTQALYTKVTLFPKPSIQVSPAVYAVVGDTIPIWADANGTISWSPDFNISCIVCDDPYVWPDVEMIYTATVEDANGCKNWDQVPIYYDPLIYVPNAFTPNGDHFNQYFKAQGLNIKSYEMLIFNRWGELIKTLTSLDDSWDGTYNGVQVQDDVYIWQIRYVDMDDDPYTLRGHVVVLK